MQTAGSVILGLPHAKYHLDPAPKPSLSASIARWLVSRSPAHAREHHPRLNPRWKPDTPTDEMDDGSALHRLLLGAGPEIMWIPTEDFRSDHAKYLRATARKAGKIPILRRRLPELQDVVAAARKQLKRNPLTSALFAPGDAEVTCLWPEGQDWCRIRVDWMPQDAREAVYDLKFTSASAAANDWEANVWKENALRSAFYLRGLAAARHQSPKEYRLVVIETEPPFGINVFAPSNDVLAYGEEQVGDALTLWSACLRTKKWPSYPPQVTHVELPAWKRQQWEEGLDRPRIAPPQRRRRATAEEVAHVQRIAAEMGQPSVS